MCDIIDNMGIDFLKKNLYKLVSMAYMIITPVSVLYAQTRPCPNGTICNPINDSTINGFIKTILEGALKIGIPVVALAVIYSGFLFVVARGNPEKLTKAREALLYTLIGAAILLGSWAIAKLISDTVLAL